MAKTLHSDFPEMKLDFLITSQGTWPALTSPWSQTGRFSTGYAEREGYMLEQKYEPFPFRPPILKVRAR